ncbi:MAG: hypothetical protein VCC00_07805, partial [Deltaproteobacteria bacterium]
MARRRRKWQDGAVCKRLLIFLLFPLLAACPKYPDAGAKQYQSRTTMALPRGVSVNVAGGNLMLRRTDLSVDTFVGEFGVGPVFNSATNSWHFNIEMSYGWRPVPRPQGGFRQALVFMDPLGAELRVEMVADETRVKGTRWVKLDDHRMKTLGGLVHEFGTDGVLAAIYWHGSAARARLVFDTNGTTTTIRQCLNQTNCKTIFMVLREAGRIVRVRGSRAGSGEATYAWDLAGRLKYARSAFDNELDNAGTKYVSTESSLHIVSPEGDSLTATFANLPLVGLHGRTQEVLYHGEGDPTWTFAYGKAQGSDPVQYWTRTTNAAGESTVHRYDKQGRVAAIEYPGGESESFVWVLP